MGWATYKIKPSGDVEFKEDKTLKTLLPTIQYWFEFPFRIIESDIVTYAGEASLNGTDYDLVFTSWGKAEPQKKIDQYLIYINKETHLIDYIIASDLEN